jgi:hypothetical protein
LWELIKDGYIELESTKAKTASSNVEMTILKNLKREVLFMIYRGHDEAALEIVAQVALEMVAPIKTLNI